MGKDLFNPHQCLVFYSKTKHWCLFCALVNLDSFGGGKSG